MKMPEIEFNLTNVLCNVSIKCEDCKFVGYDIFDRGVFCKRTKPWKDVNDYDTCEHAKRRKD